jgi:hypothetical protein
VYVKIVVYGCYLSSYGRLNSQLFQYNTEVTVVQFKKIIKNTEVTVV